MSRHRRDPATEPCTYCKSTTGKPCRRMIWHVALGRLAPVIGSKVRVPHMTGGEE